MHRTDILKFLLGAVTAAVLAFLIYQLPPVHERLEWRVDLLRAYIGGIIYPADRAPTPIARASMDPRALNSLHAHRPGRPAHPGSGGPAIRSPDRRTPAYPPADRGAHAHPDPASGPGKARAARL